MIRALTPLSYLTHIQQFTQAQLSDTSQHSHPEFSCYGAVLPTTDASFLSCITVNSRNFIQINVGHFSMVSLVLSPLKLQMQISLSEDWEKGGAETEIFRHTF